MVTLDANEINKANNVVVVAVATGKVTATIKSLAHELVCYHDHARFVETAANNVVCYVEQHKTTAMLGGKA